MSTVVQESKLQGEVFTLKMNMLSRLANGETVETCASTIEVLVGEDPDVLTMLDGDPTVVGNQYIHQRITGGVIGVIYLISFAARTDVNNILINQCKLAILPSPDLTVPELP